MITAIDCQRQIVKYHLVKLRGKYYTLLLGEHVSYTFGRRCPDRIQCRECYGCFAGCNCGCAVGEQGEEVHIQPITGT